MPDLNEWRLAYPGKTLDFGLLANDYPMKVQVEIGEASTETQDAKHPTADGVVMGKDTLGGFELTFSLTTIPDFPLSATPWRTALDLFSAFKSAWRADAIRSTPGQYATLTNLDRNRRVYGRPRKIAPKNDRLRRGIIEYVCTFDTNDPNFYSETEKAALISPVPPSGGGFTTPLVPPFSTAVGSSELAATVNAGDLPAWPVVSFHGPGRDFALSLLDGSKVEWTVQIPGEVKYDQKLVVDTRPWSRSAVLRNKNTNAFIAPANGRIRGAQLESCKIPVGTFNFQFKVTDPSGTAFADIKWRDAYASL